MSKGPVLRATASEPKLLDAIVIGAGPAGLGGEPLRFDAAYSALGVRPRCKLAIMAGAEIGDDGRLVVDDHQRTTVPGLFAAGDMVRGLNQISTAQGEGAIAATAMHNFLRQK